VNKEIVIGEKFTSIIGSDDDIYEVERNYNYRNESKNVEFKPLYRKRTIKTKDFLNGLKINFTNCTEILPIGCKYFQTFDDKKIIIIEEPPRMRTIKVDIGMEAVIQKLETTGKLKEYGYENYLKNNKTPYSFQLSFPYVVFIILLSKSNGLLRMQPYFRLHPLTNLADYLFLAPLYNIPDSQTICLGGVESFPTVLETTASIIESFWLNEYNNDYNDNIDLYQKSDAFEVHDYLSWMYFSKLDPMFIYNVKWIKHDKNMSNIITSMKSNNIMNRDSSSSYNLLHNIITGTTSEIFNHNVATKNVSYSLAFNGGTLVVGDELIFENEKMYLYSILSNDQGNSFTNVELENEKGELILVPYSEFRNGFNKLFSKHELKEANVNGKLIKPDDIITFTTNGYLTYKRIKTIRTAPDGRIEALIGNDHYLIENIEFSVMNLDDVKIDGEKLDKRKEYNIVVGVDDYNNSYRIKKMLFSHISISVGGHILIRFKPANGRDDNINLNHKRYEDGTSEYSFIDSNNFSEPGILCHYDRLIYNSDNPENLKPFQIIKDKGIFIDNSTEVRYYCSPNDSSLTQIVDKILIENKTRLMIPRISCDVDFKVGDPIVYANWENPEDMLVIYSIDKFEYDETTSKLFIHCTSLNKKVQFKIPYINFRDSLVNLGVVRKVESHCGGWKSGDKIRANLAGIPNFPKKDVNTIIAFINDGSTKYPMALCSNLCTLWMNEDTDMKFDVIPFKSKNWNKFENIPFDTTKIKWQHGDYFKTSRVALSTTKFLARRPGTKFSFEYHYSTNWGNLEWGTSITKNDLNEYKRHGILTPRISMATPRSSANKKGYPNMLGGYILDSTSRVRLMSEQFKEDF